MYVSTTSDRISVGAAQLSPAPPRASSTWVCSLTSNPSRRYCPLDTYTGPKDTQVSICLRYPATTCAFFCLAEKKISLNLSAYKHVVCEAKYRPVREDTQVSNIPLSVLFELIRAALRRLTSGKSTSNTTALLSALSARRRKYRESKPAPSDKIYKQRRDDRDS